MGIVTLVLTGLVALLHTGFFALEAILWTQPTGRKIFALSKEDAETTKVLAQNQGVYNLALAGCLVAAAALGNGGALALLLGFVIVVGLFGAATVKPTIFVLQALPAILALSAWYLGL